MCGAISCTSAANTLGVPPMMCPPWRYSSPDNVPMRPPAQLLATVLNQLLLPRLPGDAREALSGRPVEIVVGDLGLTLGLRIDRGGFVVTPSGVPWDLRISADSVTYWRLVRGLDDADRLFFERALVMEGDTELGLILKNTLDAIGPLVRRPF